MSEKRYPTRMHEVLGVEPGERFRLKNDPHGNEWFVSENGMMIMDCEDGVARSGVHNVFSAINNGIIHLPPSLTDEQREQLKAIWTLGGRWIAEDETGNVFAYDTKPQKVMICNHWNNGGYDECFTVIRELSVCSIVSWSDPEPFDIGKALGE